MPNARKKGKVFIGHWVSEDLKTRLKIQAKKQGLTASELFTNILEQHPMMLKDEGIVQKPMPESPGGNTNYGKNKRRK